MRSAVESFLAQHAFDPHVLGSDTWNTLWGGSEDYGTEKQDLDILKEDAADVIHTWDALVSSCQSSGQIQMTRNTLGFGPPFGANIQSSVTPTVNRESQLETNAEYEVYFAKDRLPTSWTLLSANGDLRANDTREALVWLKNLHESRDSLFSRIEEVPKTTVSIALQGFFRRLGFAIVSFQTLRRLSSEWDEDKAQWRKDIFHCFEEFEADTDLNKTAWAIIGFQNDQTRIVSAVWVKDWSSSSECKRLSLVSSPSAIADAVDSIPFYCRRNEEVNQAMRDSLFIRAAGRLKGAPPSVLHALTLYAVAESAPKSYTGIIARLPQDAKTRVILTEAIGAQECGEGCPWTYKGSRSADYSARIFPTPPQFLGFVMLLRLPLQRSDEATSLISSELMSRIEKA